MNCATKTQVFFAIVVLLITVPLYMFFAKYRSRHRLENLYDRAAGTAPNFKDTTDSLRAISELEKIKDPEAERMLYQIASSNSLLPGAEAQIAAIQSLERRGGDDVSLLLASLLRPDTPLEARHAAAAALSSVDCNRKCVELVLGYLKEIDDGQLNSEDDLRGLTNAELISEVKARVAPMQRQTYSLIYKALLQHQESVNSILAKQYGLGSGEPQRFSIRFVRQVHEEEACSLLLRSAEAIREYASTSKETRDSLNGAIADLSCVDKATK